MSDLNSSMTRRQFGFAFGASTLAAAHTAMAAPAAAPWMGPAVVKKVYMRKPVPTWPCPDLDVKQEIAGIEARLAEVERKHPGLRLTGGEVLTAGEDISGRVRDLGDVDGILVIDLTSGTSPLLEQLENVDIPTLLFTRPYSGWSYVDFARWVQMGRRADLIASSEFGDLDPYMRIFQTIHHLRKSKVLMVAPWFNRQEVDGYSKQFGVEIKRLGYQELRAAFEAADLGLAKREAEEFTRRALRVVEPKPEEIVDAMRFYLGVKGILERERANAITVDCLGGFRRGDLPAYPCVAWSKLNDQGYYGVCEADLHSTMTQLLVTSFCGRPGFVSDPVFDTSRNEILHAHCVSATSLLGIGAPSLPYAIRSHMEDNKGVSMQVMVPVGDTVTVGKFAGPKKFLLSTGEVAGNVDSRRGCRTQFRTKVAGARKMLVNFTGGLHRVVFYGDYAEPIEAMGRLMGFKVVGEI